MPMLNGTLALHDIRDVEAAAHRIAEDWLHHKRAYLREHDREELTAYLIGVAWELSLNHKPHICSFSQRFYRTGTLRVTDYYRTRFQDLRTPKPELALSLNGPANPTTTNEPGRTLEQTLADLTHPSDMAAQVHSDTVIRGILAGGHRNPVQTKPHMGRRPHHRTPTTPRAA